MKTANHTNSYISNLTNSLNNYCYLNDALKRLYSNITYNRDILFVYTTLQTYCINLLSILTFLEVLSR